MGFNLKSVANKATATVILFMAAMAHVATVQALTTTAVRGIVVDQQATAVVGASVRIVHTPSGSVSLATSNENGVFSARGLRVGGP